MKLAREPASSRTKPCVSLKNPHQSLQFAAPCWPSWEENRPWSEISFSLKNLSVRTFDFRAQGVTGLSATVLPDSRVPPPSEGHQIGARKKRTPGNTILNLLYRRRVSTDRLNREDSQLTASLEGEPGPTTAGKTLQHSYPETI